MADISQIVVKKVTYDIKDATAREIATAEKVGRVRPDGNSIIVDEYGVLSSVGSGGSTIYISTSESTLFGKTVTVTDGVITETTEFDENGRATVSRYMGTGWVTITASNGTKTAYAYLDCSFYGSYRATLSFFEATVNLTTSERLLYGGPVYVTSDVAPDETLTFDYTGATKYTVRVPGVYTFSIV